MKKKNKLFLDLYYKFKETGLMTASGLCDVEIDHGPNFYLRENCIFELIKPTNEDLDQLDQEDKSCMYWASDDRYAYAYVFNGLRENLLLLCAAINNEL